MAKNKNSSLDWGLLQAKSLRAERNKSLRGLNNYQLIYWRLRRKCRCESFLGGDELATDTFPLKTFVDSRTSLANF